MSSYPSEAAPVPARLIQTALGLARAELALVLLHTRELVIRAVTALLATTTTAAAFAQLGIVLLFLSPILVKVLPIENLILAVVLPLVMALAGAIGAILSWRSAQRSALHAQSLSRVSVPESSDGPSPAGRVGTHHQTEAIALAERVSQ
jgi:hypothetical protein